MDRNDLRIITRLMFRLLPMQILLGLVNSVNGIVSSFYAGNYIGMEAMSAMGLYAPVSMLFNALGTVLAGGSAIVCGKYLGKNENDKIQDVFSMDLTLSSVLAVAGTAAFVLMSRFSLTGFITSDEATRAVFDRYLLGQAVGLIPTMLANQLPCFLSIENKGNRTTAASIACVLVNLILCHVLVKMMGMGELGLSLAASAGMWMLFAVQIQYFATKEATLKAKMGKVSAGDAKEVIRTGFPGAASFIYQTLRGLIVNRLLENHTGSSGLSAFAAANNVMNLFWPIPGGMIAVSRLLMSVSIGEEDRKTLVGIMKVMVRRYIPLMLAVDAGIIASAPELGRIFFPDTSSPVYAMTVSGLRILPLCMSLSILCMHFTCYGQASGKKVYVNTLALLDGVVSVAGFSAMLIGRLGIDAVYIANVLNGAVTTLYIILYAWYFEKHVPKSIEDLMVIPDDFGVEEENRIDISITSIDEVVTVAERIQKFCLDREIDRKRAYVAALSMEEMAGNVASHGFTKDRKKHSADIRVSYKDGDVILRMKDDCVPFDPKERDTVLDDSDPAKNLGIRMIYGMTDDITYQNMLGLNVLTIRI